MTKRADRPNFKENYAGFKRGVIDDSSVNALTFSRASGGPSSTKASQVKAPAGKGTRTASKVTATTSKRAVA